MTAFRVSGMLSPHMADEPFDSLKLKPASPRRPQPGEVLWELSYGTDHYRCELRDEAPYGFDVQMFKNNDLAYSHCWESRGLRLPWAEEERHAIEGGALSPSQKSLDEVYRHLLESVTRDRL